MCVWWMNICDCLRDDVFIMVMVIGGCMSCVIRCELNSFIERGRRG